MTDRRKRGKPSKIDLLPEQIKSALDALLRDKNLTQTAILEKVNKLIADAGLSEDEQLSKSGLNRYSTQMETIGADIRQAREMAEIWVGKLGAKPTGEVTQLLLEMLKTQQFRLLINANSDPDEIMDPKAMSNLALSLQRVEQASMLNMKKEKEIRKAYAEEMAEEIDKTAVQAGLTSEGASIIKKQILGLA